MRPVLVILDMPCRWLLGFEGSPDYVMRGHVYLCRAGLPIAKLSDLGLARRTNAEAFYLKQSQDGMMRQNVALGATSLFSNDSELWTMGRTARSVN
jgi:hypothetical protein